MTVPGSSSSSAVRSSGAISLRILATSSLAMALRRRSWASSGRYSNTSAARSRGRTRKATTCCSTREALDEARRVRRRPALQRFLERGKLAALDDPGKIWRGLDGHGRSSMRSRRSADRAYHARTEHGPMRIDDGRPAGRARMASGERPGRVGRPRRRGLSGRSPETAGGQVWAARGPLGGSGE